MIARFDVDMSGDLSFNEFLALMEVWTEEDEIQMLEAFRVSIICGRCVVCVRACVYGYVCMCVCKCVLCMYVFMCVHVFVYMYAFMLVCVYVCVCMYVSVCVCLCVCMCMPMNFRGFFFGFSKILTDFRSFQIFFGTSRPFSPVHRKCIILVYIMLAGVGFFVFQSQNLFFRGFWRFSTGFGGFL